MTVRVTAVLVAAAAVCAAAGRSATPSPTRPGAATASLPPRPGLPAVNQQAKAKLARTSLYFEPNVGQVDNSVKFLARGGGFVTLLTGQEAFFGNNSLKEPLQLSFTGARKPLAAHAEEKLPGISNYFRGKDPSKWRTDVPHYAKVRFDGVYPGVDVVFYSGQQRLEYDFIVAPGADPSVIEVAWKGADRIRVDEAGDLVLSTSAGEIRQRRPEVYQEINGSRVSVAARYRKGSSGGFKVELASYDRKRALVIDPVMIYSTFLGGNQADEILGITADITGAAYITGYTKSANFPLASPIQNTITSINNDAFITKIHFTGQQLVYSTFLGGEGEDRATGVAADPTGNAYITGFTTSFGYPVTTNTYQKDYTGTQDAFVTKINPNGNVLTYSSYLGTSDTFELGYSIGVDYAGYCTVAGITNSPSFPTSQNAYDTTFNGSNDIFVVKMALDGRSLIFSTYLGGVANDIPYAMLIDRAGEIWLGGSTASVDFPTTANAYGRTHKGLDDGFILKMSQDGKHILLSTLIGSSGPDSVFALAMENEGRIVVSGQAGGANFPTTANAYDRTFRGVADAFAARFSSDLGVLIASTILGTPSYEFANGAKPGPGGHILLSGYTESSNFPSTPDAFGFSASANGDAFFSVFEPLANKFKFSSILSGTTLDVGRGMAQDANGDVYVAGQTFSSGFPITSEALDTTYNGSGDGFITKIGSFDLRECTSTVTPTATTYPIEGGGGGVGVGEGCVWYAFSTAPWVTLTSNPLTLGGGSTNYTVAPNGSADPRTAAVYTAGNIVQLLQKGSSGTAPFNDVAPSDPFVDHIRIIKSNSVTSGCTITDYCPGDNTTRGQMAVFIVRSLLGTDDFVVRAAPYFADVPANHPQFKWIQKMRELNITTGCDLLNYCPDSAVTRGQMAVFLVRSKFGSFFAYPETPYFTDIPTNNVFYPYIQKFRQLGVTTGCAANQFCPNDTNTRGQMAVFLTRMYFTPW